MYKAMLNSTRVLKRLLRRADIQVQPLLCHVLFSCFLKKVKTLKEHERSRTL